MNVLLVEGLKKIIMYDFKIYFINKFMKQNKKQTEVVNGAVYSNQKYTCNF